jgi:hypothetical protein
MTQDNPKADQDHNNERTDMSEYDEQMKRFKKGVDNPDEVIDAHSVAKIDGDTGTIYYFLTRDGRCVKVELLDE